MTEARILVICSHNVCRSPYLAALLAARLADSASVSVSSRGTDVAERTSMCVLARQRLEARGFERLLFTGHKSRRLSRADIADADLILTAEVAHRAAVARLDPGSRARTFTMREALLLSDAQPAPAGGSLNRFVEMLNTRRGTIDVPRSSARRLFRRSGGDQPERALDIPDGHVSGSAVHERIFPGLDDDASRLGARLSAFLTV